MDTRPTHTSSSPDGDLLAGQAADVLDPRASGARLAADLAGMRRLYALHAQLATETNLQAALDAILAAAVAFLETDRGCVQFVSADGERLEMFAWHGYGADSPFITHFRSEGSKAACDLVRQHRQRLIIEDVTTFPPLVGTTDRVVALADGIRATQSTPLVSRSGELIGVLSTQFRQPHRPSDDALRLIDLLAWTAADFVARQRAETALRASEQRQAFLLTLSDRLRPLADPVAIQNQAMRVLGQHLGVLRAQYYEVAPDDEHLVSPGGYADGAEPLTGRYRMDDFGAYVKAAFRDGRTLAVADVLTDARVRAAERAAYGALGIRAFVGVPLVKGGRFVIGLGIHHATPRAWTADEVALLEETAERTWAAVERARAEAALRESEAKYRTLFESIDEGFCLLERVAGADPVDFRYVEANPAFAAQIGVGAVVGHTIRALFPGAPEAGYAVYERVWQTGTPVRTALDVPSIGQVIELFAFRVDGASGRRVAVVFNNITARTQAEAAMVAALAAEQQARAAEQQARTELEEANRLKDDFLAAVSHELRTPITAMLGYAHLLSARADDAAYVARTGEKLVRSATTQARLVEDLLDVSRSLSATLRVARAPLALVPVVQAAIDTVRPALQSKGVQLRLALSRADTQVLGDAQRLQQVVWNLLSNAVKFTPSGGRIDVEVQPLDGQVQLVVRDTGQGISAAFLPDVFERFRQEDAFSTRAAEGLGLGLAIVKQLIELHGGTIELYSAGLGQGTTVRVALPRSGAERTADTEADRPVRARTPRRSEPECPPELAGLRVLVVDDQRAIVELLDETLGACGAEVRCHTAAAAALRELRAWQPDVLIADIAMPGHDGYWLIEQVRALPPEQGGTTPALALTAYVRIEDRLRVLHAGYQLFVPKPIEPAELRTSVARLIHLDTRDAEEVRGA